MTTQQAIHHPTAANLVHFALGAAAYGLLQHGIDVKEQVATIQQFLGSDEAHALLVACIGIFSAVRQGTATQPSTVYVQTPGATNWSAPGATVTVQPLLAAPLSGPSTAKV